MRGALLASPFGRGGCDQREQTERAIGSPFGKDFRAVEQRSRPLRRLRASSPKGRAKSVEGAFLAALLKESQEHSGSVSCHSFKGANHGHYGSASRLSL